MRWAARCCGAVAVQLIEPLRPPEPIPRLFSQRALSGHYTCSKQGRHPRLVRAVLHQALVSRSRAAVDLRIGKTPRPRLAGESGPWGAGGARLAGHGAVGEESVADKLGRLAASDGVRRSKRAVAVAADHAMRRHALDI